MDSVGAHIRYFQRNPFTERNTVTLCKYVQPFILVESSLLKHSCRTGRFPTFSIKVQITGEKTKKKNDSPSVNFRLFYRRLVFPHKMLRLSASIVRGMAKRFLLENCVSRAIAKANLDRATRMRREREGEEGEPTGKHIRQIFAKRRRRNREGQSLRESR